MPLPPPPAIGQVALYRRFTLLEADTYSLAMNINDGSSVLLTSSALDFELSGARFSLLPGDFQTLLPAPTSVGPVSDHIPLVTFYNKTTPWERAVGDGSGGAWIALLLLRDGEEQTDGGPLNSGKAVFTNGSTVSALLAATDGVTVPALQNVSADELAQPCIFLDIGSSLFQTIAPTLAEIDLLAHVRQVSTEDKELLGQDDDGWFSTVCGNRLPRAPTNQDGDTGPVNHVACLVSVEGQGPAFADPGAQQQAVRVAVLASWRFQCIAPSTASFYALGAGLSVGALGGAAEGAMASGDGGPPNPAPPPAHASSDGTGYVPLPCRQWDGQTVRAWYRGPCSPIPVYRDAALPPLHAAEQAIVPYPPGAPEGVGVENDVSYAAAFELGRLLALSDRTFALELLKWRHDAYTNLDQDVFLAQLATVVGHLGDEDLKFSRVAEGQVLSMAGDVFTGSGITPALERYNRVALHKGMVAAARAHGIDPKSLAAALRGDVASAEGIDGEGS